MSSWYGPRPSQQSFFCNRCNGSLFGNEGCCTRCGTEPPRQQDKCCNPSSLIQPYLAATGASGSSVLPTGQLLPFDNGFKSKMIVPVSLQNDSFRFCISGAYQYLFVGMGGSTGISGTVQAALNGSLFGFGAPVQIGVQNILSGVVNVKTNDVFGIAALGSNAQPTIVNNYTLVITQISC